MDIITEIGAEFTLDPIIKGLKIDYITDNGNTFVCSEDFGLIDELTVTWAGDQIEKVVFK